MVHNLVELDHDTREKLEKGGGTKAATKLIRAAFGNSFCSFVDNNEKFFCDGSLEPFAWWKEGRQEASPCPMSLKAMKEADRERHVGLYFKE